MICPPMFSSLIFLIIISNVFQRGMLQEFDGRIVGGHPTTILAFPYHLGVIYNMDTYLCGAALISPVSAITGAHCILSNAEDSYSIRAGSSIRNFGGLLVNVNRIIKHPQFNKRTMDYDVAILILSHQLPTSLKIVPIRLPEMYENPRIGTKAIVTGWGLTNPSDPNSSSRILRSVDVQIIDQYNCILFFGTNVITNRMMCAGYVFGGKDACQGDSGGPLVQNGKLIGIVSWGIDCAQPYYPGIYTRTSQVRAFIRQHAGI